MPAKSELVFGVMEAVLGAALIGIEESMIPAVPVVGNCYEADVPQLPDQWATGNTIGVELIYYAKDFFQPTVLRSVRGVAG